MFELSAEVIYNRRIKKGYFEIALSARKIAKTALPGQFVNIKVSDGLEPLLRRPISIHRVSGNKIFLLYEVLGKGTRMLSGKKSRERLDVLGPLGNGFKLDRRPILVAGGMGTAPLVFLAEKLAKDKTLVLIGAKTKDSILCEKEFKDLGCEVMVSTDDGSRGFRGYVSELLKQELSTIDYRPPGHGLASYSQSHRPSTIYACGPSLLLKEISRISLEHNIPAQLSLESHMACGIGACMGCVIKVKSKKAKGKTDDEYKRVCKEGPVFEAREIIW